MENIGIIRFVASQYSIFSMSGSDYDLPDTHHNPLPLMLDAVEDMNHEQYEADLGGNIYKK